MKEEIVSLGAESEIRKISMWGQIFAAKHRPRKEYLLKELDTLLRYNRTVRECKALNMARRIGVPTPVVHCVDLNNYTLFLDYISGEQLKRAVTRVSQSVLHDLCSKFGRLIAELHKENIVHGDPTTSNVIIDDTNRLWLIDFGLAEFNADIEMKGVDLHLIQRALETTHWNIQEEMLDSTLQGYIETLGDSAEANLSRMEEIRTRGRYH